MKHMKRPTELYRPFVLGFFLLPERRALFDCRQIHVNL